MKKKTTIQFFFFIILIGQLFLCFSANNVSGQVREEYKVLKDNFQITLSPSATKSSGFGTEISDTAITKFQNLGILGYTEESREIIYQANVEMKIIFNVFSMFDIPMADADGRTSYTEELSTWLKMRTATCTTMCIPDWSQWYYYYIRARTFNFDYTKLALDGVNLKIKYNPLEERGLTFKGQNISATIPPTEAHYEKIIAKASHHGDIAQYKDKFANYDTENMVKLGATDLITADTAKSVGEAQAKFDYKLKQLNLGATPATLTEETIQQSSIQSMSSGSTTYLNAQDIVTTKLPLTLKPNIIRYNQRIKIRYCWMQVDTTNGWVFKDAGVTYCSPVSEWDMFSGAGRVAGIHINNYYIQQEIQVKFKLLSTLKLNVPLSDTILANPEIIRGDYIWDLSIYGDTGVDIVVTETLDPLKAIFNWIMQWIWVIVGIIVIILILYVVIKLLPIGVKATKKYAEKRINKK